MDDPADEHPGVTFEAFRQSFYYGSHADMQFKFLAARPDDAAADATHSPACSTGWARLSTPATWAR